MTWLGVLHYVTKLRYYISVFQYRMIYIYVIINYSLTTDINVSIASNVREKYECMRKKLYPNGEQIKPVIMDFATYMYISQQAWALGYVRRQLPLITKSTNYSPFSSCSPLSRLLRPDEQPFIVSNLWCSISIACIIITHWGRLSLALGQPGCVPQ